jgi:dTDP-4-dehydrorhamnose reductase
MRRTADDRPEVWAGIECTVNRVGDRYFDQLVSNGHHRRPDDLDRLAALGIRAVRYPILWEHHHPDPDWARPDERLTRLRALGVRPIVGLVHHGSGPPHTSLLDPMFADGLAAHAARVAERYPWVTDYTPVNEPLTTARFAGLYGHWYPHGRDTLTFLRALIVECRATVLAMRAVREVNPAARLVQTEDLGQTHAPPRLQYQADFENDRRWLSWDLLCGRVDRAHPLRPFLRSVGLPDADVDWFRDHPCPPDVLGVNHYVTSERYLDPRLDRYPPHLHGGNGRHAYVDVEAVRVLADGPAGPESLLTQTWDRYTLPIAVTEAHLGCTRDEQLRWLRDVWQAACRARAAGADVRAVTAWSAFGAFDWDALVTRETGHYEPGLFDVRGGSPRPTAVARLVGDLAAGRAPDHPGLDGPGWWARSQRLFEPAGDAPPAAGRPVLVTGGAGRLGRAVARVCAVRGLACVLLRRDQLDIADPTAVERALRTYRPWAVVNAAGYVLVDEAEAEPDRCRRANVVGPTVLAAACSGRGLSLVTFSSALVFDGQAGRPYREADPVAPLGVYGQSKVEGERAVRAAHPGALVIRTSALFGPWDDRNFVSRALRAIRGGNVFPAAEDVTVTPSYAPDLIHAALDLLIDGEHGVWHLTHPDPITWADLARAVAREAGLDPAGVAGRPAATLGWQAPRPPYSALATERGCLLPSLAAGLSRYLRDAAPGVGC